MHRVDEPVSPEVDAVAKAIVDAAFKVHQALGPGLLECVYESCMCHELSKRGIVFERQRCWPIEYEGVRLESGLRIDLLVEKQVLVELKAVDQLLPLFDAQVLTYLKLTGLRLGLLINFNVPLLKHGVKRFIR
mgnify:CR=1 FL=1